MPTDALPAFGQGVYPVEPLSDSGARRIHQPSHLTKDPHCRFWVFDSWVIWPCEQACLERGWRDGQDETPDLRRRLMLSRNIDEM